MIVPKRYNMKTILAALCTFVFLLTVLSAHGQDQAGKNLLFIITDQQRYDALGYAGNEVIQTPNLDRLAEQGVFFRNAYTPCAVCGPARSSILTGSRVERTGVISNNETYYNGGEGIMSMPTFDEILSENGWHCEYYGKWHALSSHAGVYENPVQTAENGKSVFGPGGQSHIWRDYLAGVGEVPAPGEGEFVDGMSKWPYLANPLDRFFGMSNEELQSQDLKHSQPDQHGKLQLDREHTLTAFQARQTMEALDRLKDTTFSITCSFHFPHSPMLAPEPFYGMYPVEEMLPPASISDPMDNSPYADSNQRKKRTEYADPQKIKYMISEYYGLVSEIDHWVGEILDKLDSLGIADNTLVIFTSDHGEMLGAHGMREKNIFYEESAHIPLLMRFPEELEPGNHMDGYVSLVDLFPTILDYLGVPEEPSDGVSLRGLIEGRDTIHGSYVVTEWDRPGISNYMVVKDGWKLIIPYTISSPVLNALYNLNTDPHEMLNLLGNNPDRAQYLEKAEGLRDCLLEWLAKRNSVHTFSVAQRDLMDGGKPTGNNATFISQDIPELMEGDTVEVSVTMENTGLTAWTSRGNFVLASQAPAENMSWNVNRVSLSPGDSILPGMQKTFNFEVVVPEIDGILVFQWQMRQEGEEWFGQKSDAKQLLIGDPGSYLDACDEISGWKSSAALSLNSSVQQQGTACLEFSASSTDEFKKVFSVPCDTRGSVETTELTFWYYVSDVSKLESSNQVEIGSAGKNDVDEFNWNLQGLTNGWNLVKLRTSEAGKMGSPDLSKINWFRIYRRKTGEVTTRLDGIRLIDPLVGPAYTLLVAGGTGGGRYFEADEVTISAHSPPNGSMFDTWVIESGDPVIDDPFASQTTLTMGAESASLMASYKVAVGIQVNDGQSQMVRIYPNPADSEVRISLNLEEQSELRLSLWDLSGRRAMEGSRIWHLDPGYGELILPVDNLSPGAYTLKLNMNGRAFSRLLMIR
jgi:arylsulfatase A-like enzyme